MKPYQNIAGNSGVVSYETGSDYIDVRFRGKRKIYRYTHQTAGKAAVEKAKRLAQSGKGLSGHISQQMRVGYEK